MDTKNFTSTEGLGYKLFLNCMGIVLQNEQWAVNPPISDICLILLRTMKQGEIFILICYIQQFIADQYPLQKK